MGGLGPITEMQLQDPVFASVLWKLTPASFASRLSAGSYKAWSYIQLLSRKLVDVAAGRCPRLIVCLPPRHGKPICKNEPVLLSDGSIKKLSSIEIGDCVVTHNARGRKVLAVYEQPKLDCVGVTTKTGRHSIFALDHTVLSSVGWIEAGKLRIGQGLAQLRHFEANRHSERSCEEFRFAGYIIGDGAVTSGSVLSVTDQVERLDAIECARSFGCAVGDSHAYGGISFLGMRPWLRSAELFGKNAHEKVVPSWVYTASNGQIANFLAGYFATDGAVNDSKIRRKSGDRIGDRIGPVLEYCSVSHNLLASVQSLLSRLDISSNLRPKLGKYKGKDHHSWRLIISDRPSLVNFLEKIVPLVRHSVKSELLHEWMELFPTLPFRERQLTRMEIAEIKESTLSYSHLVNKYGVGNHILWNIKKGLGKNLPYDDQYFFDEIVALEACVEDCRCLKVDEDETFVANDFVVHNSFLISQWFPPWYLEQYPDRKIILASYEADFAAKWGGRARDIVAENQDLLALRFKAKNPAMHHWETTEDGAMVCAGVGGPITGKGCNVLIIDDYVKNPCSNKTPVTLSSGTMKCLGDLVVGESVITMKGRGRRVLSIFERGECDCVKVVTFSGREFVAELTHPCLTMFGWERAGALQVGQRLCLPKSYEFDTITNRSVEEFRLAGYITGDGCCNTQVAMAVSDEEEKLDFEACVIAAGLKSTRPGKSRDAGALHVSGGISWAKAAQMHGKVAATKVVPPWVFTSSNERVANFVGAYFATDGHVSSCEDYTNGLAAHAAGGKLVSGSIISFASVSRELLKGVQILLSRFSIYSQLRSTRVKYRGEWRYFWTLYITSRESVKLFIENIPVHHSTKRPRLEAWLKYLLSRPKGTSVEVLKFLGLPQFSGVSPNVLSNLRTGKSSGDRLSPIGEEYVYDKIVSIEPCREKCRCIEVEEDSSFLADGLIVHNSEEANSRTMREKTWDWWTSTARTRIEPFIDRRGRKIQPAVIVMATRWHSDDLIGRLIDPQFSNDKGEREKWEVFVFPACAEPDAERHYRQFGVKVNDVSTDAMSGEAHSIRMRSIREQLAETDTDEWRDVLGRRLGEALCPDRFNERDLAMFRSTSLRDWYALYQQRPGDEADDGNVYHRFDERGNCKPLDRDENMQLFVSMDFNVDPMSVLIGQYDRGNGIRYMERCEVLEELVIPNSNTHDMMGKLLLELQKYQWGYTLEIEVYGDAAGSQRSPNSAKTNWQIVSEHLSMNPSIHYRFVRKGRNPMIADRVNAVNTMLKSADGSTRLYVDDVKCPELIKDFKKVKWQTDSAGNSTGMLDKSDRKRTHISDALGYMVEFNFSLRSKGGGRKGILQ